MGKIVMKSKERSYGIDILKIMATFMVVILHVNGFILDSKTIDDFTRTTKLVWHFSEAFAYPAIHLFVMITAWFAIDRTFNYKSIINVWLQTIQVCILGIVIAFFANLSINVNDLFVSSLPFIGRAYWYVTDYILLMLMSPILNIVVNRLSNKQLIKFVILLLGMLSIGPLFFATYNWNQDYSNIGLFILLYFITAVIKRNEEIYTKMMGGIIWLISLFVLVSSWVGIHLLGKYGIVSCLEKEMFFYQYCSPFVISQAVGLVMLFSKINIVTINEFAKKMIKVIVNASLVIYLVHMHPVFKNRYVEMGVFSWVNVNDVWLYVIESIVCILIIFIVGILVSIPITTISKSIEYKILHEYNITTKKKT